MSSSPFSSSPCPHTSLTSSPFSGGRRRIRPQGLRPVPGVEVRPPGRLRTLRLAGRVQLHLWVPGIFLSLHPLRYRQHPPFDLIGLACWLGTGFCCCDAPPCSVHLVSPLFESQCPCLIVPDGSSNTGGYAKLDQPVLLSVSGRKPPPATQQMNRPQAGKAQRWKKKLPLRERETVEHCGCSRVVEAVCEREQCIDMCLALKRLF
jgi:hypothetical protein